jgi:uncharacterized protein YggT (Ycf19 family)
MTTHTVEEFERRAQEAEASRVPTFLRVARGVVLALYAVVVAIVIILLVTFVLRLLGASTDAAFTRWLYRNADAAMRPFRGIFPPQELGDVSVVDVSLLFGCFVYVLAALGIDMLVQSLTNRLTRKTEFIADARSQADAIRLQIELQRLQAEQAASLEHALAHRVTLQQRAAEEAALLRQPLA